MTYAVVGRSWSRGPLQVTPVRPRAETAFSGGTPEAPCVALWEVSVADTCTRSSIGNSLAVLVCKTRHRHNVRLIGALRQQ